jgi:hypothetical protein
MYFKIVLLLLAAGVSLAVRSTMRRRAHEQGRVAPGFFDIPVQVGVSVAAAWCLWAAASYFVVGNQMVSIAMQAVNEKRDLSTDEVKQIDALSEWWMFGQVSEVKNVVEK